MFDNDGCPDQQSRVCADEQDARAGSKDYKIVDPTYGSDYTGEYILFRVVTLPDKDLNADDAS